MHDQLYANRSVIRAALFKKNDFELKPMDQHPFHDILHDHPMDHLVRFEGLESSI